MPGHADIVFTNAGAPNASAMNIANSSAHRQYRCPHAHCGKYINGAVIARTKGDPQVTWLRCTACGGGAVINVDQLAPVGLEGELVEGLPAEVEAAYEEARKNAAASAHTSCELMCRKILMHVAVDKGANPNKTFAEYLKHLEDSGYVTPPMKQWVDLIRKNGNIATHELPATDRARAIGTLTFTAQLLRLIYEMDHKVSQFLPPPPSAGP